MHRSALLKKERYNISIVLNKISLILKNKKCSLQKYNSLIRDHKICNIRKAKKNFICKLISRTFIRRNLVESLFLSLHFWKLKLCKLYLLTLYEYMMHKRKHRAKLTEARLIHEKTKRKLLSYSIVKFYSSTPNKSKYLIEKYGNKWIKYVKSKNRIMNSSISNSCEDYEIKPTNMLRNHRDSNKSDNTLQSFDKNFLVKAKPRNNLMSICKDLKIPL